MIDRGVAADSSFPAGNALLMSTSDRAQCPRGLFRADGQGTGGRIPDRGAGRQTQSRRGRMCCFSSRVSPAFRASRRCASRRAPADSSDLVRRAADGLQPDECAALAGAGRQRAMVRSPSPCNHPQKFPLPAVAIFSTRAGATAIRRTGRAWRGREKASSSASPLSRPFGWQASERSPGVWELRLHRPPAGLRPSGACALADGPVQNGIGVPTDRARHEPAGGQRPPMAAFCGQAFPVHRGSVLRPAPGELVS